MFKIWKTITLGTHPNMRSLKQEIKLAGCRIGAYAEQVIDDPYLKMASEITEVDIVRPTLSELGLPKDATYGDIYARPISLGLEIRDEVSAQLAREYKDQPTGECLHIPVGGSVDPSGTGRRRNVLRLVHSHDARQGRTLLYNGVYLESRYYRAQGDVYDPFIVFVQPRKSR